MYEDFYGFSERPFQLTPDPSFYFESATHKKALSYLGYGLSQHIPQEFEFCSLFGSESCYEKNDCLHVI